MLNEGQKALIKLLRLFSWGLRVTLSDYDEYKLDELKDAELIDVSAADWNWFDIRLTVKGQEVEID